MTGRNRQTTFAMLDEAEGKKWTISAEDAELPLPKWYKSVRDTPIDLLTVRDLGIACRQNVHMPEILPIVLSRLESDPLAGSKYEGELLAAVASIPTTFWKQHQRDAERATSIIRKSIGRMDEEQRQDAVRLLRIVRTEYEAR